MLGCLNIQTVMVPGENDFPMVKTEKFFPIETDIMEAFENIKSLEGMKIYKLAREIADSELFEDEKGEMKPKYNMLEAMVIVRTSSDPEIVEKYSKQIIEITQSQYTSELEKRILVTVLLNTRVDQSWHIENRKSNEEQLSKVPQKINGIFKIDNPKFAFFQNPKNEPKYNLLDERLYWTSDMTYLLPGETIDKIYEFALGIDPELGTPSEVEALKNKIEGDPDFLEEF